MDPHKRSVTIEVMRQRGFSVRGQALRARLVDAIDPVRAAGPTTVDSGGHQSRQSELST